MSSDRQDCYVVFIGRIVKWIVSAPQPTSCGMLGGASPPETPLRILRGPLPLKILLPTPPPPSSDENGGGEKISPEHPSPILHTPRDNISRKGESLTLVILILATVSGLFCCGTSFLEAICRFVCADTFSKTLGNIQNCLTCWGLLLEHFRR